MFLNADNINDKFCVFKEELKLICKQVTNVFLLICIFHANLIAGPVEDRILKDVRDLVDNAKFGEAAKFLKQELIKNPNNVILTSSLADTYILLKKYDLAIEFAKSAILINPKFSWPYTLLIKSYILTDNFNKASLSIRKLRDLGMIFDADFYTGEFYRARSEHKKAAYFYEKILKTKNNQDFQEITAYNYTQGKFPYSSYRHLYEGYLQDKQNTKFVHALVNNLMMRSQFQEMEKILNEHGRFCTQNKICDKKSQFIKNEYFHQKKPIRGVYFGNFGLSLFGAYTPELLSSENFIRYKKTNNLNQNDIQGLPKLGMYHRLKGAARLQFASNRSPRIYLDLDFNQLADEDIPFSEFRNVSAKLSMNLHYKLPLYGDILLQPWLSVSEIDGVNGSLNSFNLSGSSVTQIYSLGLDYNSSPNFYHSEISLKLAGSYGVNDINQDKFILLDSGLGLRKLFLDHLVLAINGGFVGLRSLETDYIDERLSVTGEVGVVFLNMFIISAIQELIWHYDDPKDLSPVFSHISQSKIKFKYFSKWMTLDSEYFLFRGLNENAFDFDAIDTKLTFKIPVDSPRWYHQYKYTNRQFLDVSIFHKYIDDSQPHKSSVKSQSTFGAELSVAW